MANYYESIFKRIKPLPIKDKSSHWVKQKPGPKPKPKMKPKKEKVMIIYDLMFDAELLREYIDKYTDVMVEFDPEKFFVQVSDDCIGVAWLDCLVEGANHILLGYMFGGELLINRIRKHEGRTYCFLGKKYAFKYNRVMISFRCAKGFPSLSETMRPLVNHDILVHKIIAVVNDVDKKYFRYYMAIDINDINHEVFDEVSSVTNNFRILGTYWED